MFLFSLSLSLEIQQIKQQQKLQANYQFIRNTQITATKQGYERKHTTTYIHIRIITFYKCKFPSFKKKTTNRILQNRLKTIN